MVRIAKRINALFLSGILVLALASPAMAADKPDLLIAPNPTTGMPISTRPMEVPISQETSDLDGFKYIKKVFEVNSQVQPDTLIEDDFEKDGFQYTLDSIIKSNETASSVTKNVSTGYEADTATDDVWEILKTIPTTVRYDDGGYVGDLYLLPTSLRVVVSSVETKTSRWTVTDSITKQVEYNDESEFPETVQKNGYTLTRTGLTFQEGEYLPDSAIPSYYIGTATYGKTLSSSKEVPAGYTVKARYVGEATKDNGHTCVYTVTYRGEKIDAKPDFGVQIASWFASFAILALIAAIIVLIIIAARKIGALYAKVEAQDEETGQYSKIQSVRMDKNTPIIELDELKAPAAKHFLITLSRAYSEQIKGKIILVKTARRTYKHQVESNYGMPYKFNIDLEPVLDEPLEEPND